LILDNVNIYEIGLRVKLNIQGSPHCTGRCTLLSPCFTTLLGASSIACLPGELVRLPAAKSRSRTCWVDGSALNLIWQMFLQPWDGSNTKEMVGAFCLTTVGEPDCFHCRAQPS